MDLNALQVKFRAFNDEAQGLSFLIGEFCQEIALQGRLRQVSSASQMRGLLEEINKKWNVLAVEFPSIKPEGLKEFHRQFLPEIYKQWMANESAN